MWKTIIFIFLISIANAQELQQFQIKGALQGVNTKISPRLLPKELCQFAQNVLFDETLGFNTRFGAFSISSFPVAGKTAQKIWGYEKSSGEKYLIAQVEGSLYYTIDKINWTLIRSGLSWELNPLQMTVFDNKAWFTNGVNYLFYFDRGEHDGNLYGEVKLGFIIGKYILSHNNKLFVANTYDSSSGIFYGRDDQDPTDTASWVAGDREDAGYEDGDRITGLSSDRGVLLIHKKFSLWGLFGYSYEDWEIQRISDYGCQYQESVCLDKGEVKFLSDKGEATFNGSFCSPIDGAVRDEFKDCNNLKGEYYFWQQSEQDEFNTGKSTGLTVTTELTLEDVSKVWSSSNTYPTAFSTTTVLGSSSDFDATDIVNDSVRLAKINASTDTVVETDLIGRIFKFVRTGIVPATIYFDVIYNDDYAINDIDSNYLTTIATFDKLDGTDISYQIGEDPYYTMNNFWIFDFGISSETTITKCKVKFYLHFPAFHHRFRYNSGQTLPANYSMDVPINIAIKGYKTTGWEDITDIDSVVPFKVSDFDNSGFPYNPDIRGLINSVDYLIDKEIEFFSDEYTEYKVNIGISYVKPDECYSVKWSCELSSIYNIGFYADPNASPQYKSTGTLTSEIHDKGYLVYLSTAVIDCPCLQTGTTALFAIRSSSWSSTMSGATYYAFADGDALPSQLSPCQYIQVRSSFSATEISVGVSSYTPILHSIEIGAVKSTGSWVSSKFSAEKVYLWKYAVMIDNQPLTDTGISYAVRTATGSTALDSAAWDWISTGEILDPAVHPSSHTWIMAKSTMATTNGIRVPIIESITITYAPEADTIVPASISIDNRLLVALSTGTDSTKNDVVMVQDKMNNWTFFKGWNASSFARVGNKYYMADNTLPKIYQIHPSTVTTDDGTPITSIYKKYVGFDSVDFDNYVYHTYITGKEGTGTYDFQYSYENSTPTYTPVKNQEGDGFFRHRINMRAASGINGIFETVKSTNPLEIHSISNYYRRERLR